MFRAAVVKNWKLEAHKNDKKIWEKGLIWKQVPYESCKDCAKDFSPSPIRIYGTLAFSPAFCRPLNAFHHLTQSAHTSFWRSPIKERTTQQCYHQPHQTHTRWTRTGWYLHDKRIISIFVGFRKGRTVPVAPKQISTCRQSFVEFARW